MKKITYILGILILVVIILHISFFYSMKSIVNASNSINPKATNYFIHANVISTLYIHNIQKIPFLDYDSSIVKPFINLTDYFFKKGEVYLNKNNAENAVWWYLTYGKIFNITKESVLNNTMRVYATAKEENLKQRMKISSYIISLGKNGVKGINFGKYESSAMHTLFVINFAHYNISVFYKGSNFIEKANKYWNDNEIFKIKLNTYNSYKNFIDNDSYISRYKYVNDNLFERVSYLISYQYFKNSKKIQCNSFVEDYNKFIKKKNILSNDNKDLFNLIQKQCN